MAHHAIAILEDDQRLQSFKENAYTRAKEFDLKLILPIYEEYYQEIIDQAR
jgi:hypothetical protein